MSTSCDVLVVGAGVAGAAAAVAAARNGARTILVEKEPYLGGTGYAGLFQHICGLYLNGDTVPTETLNGGIVREITVLLHHAAPTREIMKIGQVYVLPYSREDLQAVLTALCYGEKYVAILRGQTVVSVTKEAAEIQNVIINGSRGKQVILPKMVIDCSGNGEVAAMAGAGFNLAAAEERQLAGYVVKVEGLIDADEGLWVKVPYHLAQGVSAGMFKPETRFTTFSQGENPGEGFCKMSVAGDDRPGRDDRARKEADAMIVYLASMIPAFAGARIADTSLRVLEREGRRVNGEYVLTEDDVLGARKFPDGVVKNAWPIELWDRSRGTQYRYVPCGEHYEIPFRCLMVRGFPNLLTAGRCISVSHAALGSTRVMGTCIALGEQAGKAAAYRIQNRNYPLDMKSFSEN